MGKQAQPLADLVEPINMRSSVLETRDPRDPDFKIFTRGMEVEKAAGGGDGKTRIKCIASSSIEDRHGDTITEAAIRGMARQAIGLTIFRNHTYDVPESIFGYVETAKAVKTTVAAAKDKGMLPDHLASGEEQSEIALLQLGVVVDPNEKASQTITSLENGTTLGISIGAMILEYEEKETDGDSWMAPLIINKVDLLEASVVGIPANPLSWVEGATKAIAIQKGLVGERATREDVYRAIDAVNDSKTVGTFTTSGTWAPTTVTVGESGTETITITRETTVETDEPEEPEKPDEVEVPEEDQPEEETTASVEPNHTQDDPAAIVNYYRHLIHDDLADEGIDFDEIPTQGELKVLVRDKLLAWKNAYPSDEEMDEVMDAINEDRPLEAETTPNADADSTEEEAADTDAQEAAEASDPEPAEGTDSEAEKAATAEVQKLVEAGMVATVMDAVGLLEQTFTRLIETAARADALEAENAELRGRVQTADEEISRAVDFVNKVMDLPLIRKSAVRAEGNAISSRLIETYGDVLDLKGKGSS